MLFPLMADSSYYQEAPLYVARLQEDGEFLLPHLAAGDYRLFAVQDLDADMRMDEGEKMAFLSDTIRPLVSDSLGQLLHLFRPADAPETLHDFAWSSDGRFLRVISGLPDSIAPITGPAMDKLRYRDVHLDRPDSIQLWFAPPVDEGDFVLMGADDDMDTLSVGRVKAKDDYPSLIGKVELYHADTAATFRFVRPVMSVDTSLIQFIADSVPLVYTIDSIPEPTKTLLWQPEWEEGNRYTLRLWPGAFTDIYGQVNDSLEQILTVPAASTFGELTLDLTLPGDGKFIIELVDRTKEVKRTMLADSSFTWSLSYLTPGTYGIRVINDLDGNRRWTTGDFRSNRSPEPVFMSAPSLVVRANWQVEEAMTVLFDQQRSESDELK